MKKKKLYNDLGWKHKIIIEILKIINHGEADYDFSRFILEVISRCPDLDTFCLFMSIHEIITNAKYETSTTTKKC